MPKSNASEEEKNEEEDKDETGVTQTPQLGSTDNESTANDALNGCGVRRFSNSFKETKRN